jgi:glutathione S-transferase
MDLYMFPGSTNCRKVDAVAKQLGIELNYKVVDLIKGEHRQPWFLALNPNAMVPVLVDGDVTLTESNAIACYIASKVENDLWPRSNLRYEVMRWQAWELAHFGAAVRELAWQRLIKPRIGQKPDNARCDEEVAKFERFASVLERQLQGRRFVANDQLTLADFCLGSSLAVAQPIKLSLSDYPNIRRWLAGLEDQPGWRASAPPPM